MNYRINRDPKANKYAIEIDYTLFDQSIDLTKDSRLKTNPIFYQLKSRFKETHLESNMHFQIKLSLPSSVKHNYSNTNSQN